ncbi:hypothetical protein D3C80_1769530 [compost metagenome]
MGEETRNYGIAHGELRHPGTHRGDDTCAIGHGDASILHTDETGDYAEVVVVERAGMDAHLDFARLGRVGGWHVDKAQVVQATRVLELDGFHRGP